MHSAFSLFLFPNAVLRCVQRRLCALLRLRQLRTLRSLRRFLEALGLPELCRHHGSRCLEVNIIDDGKARS